MDGEFTVTYAFLKDRFEERSLEEIARYTGCEVDKERSVIFFTMLDQRFAIHHPSAQVIALPGTKPEMTTYIQNIVLDYMSNTSDVKEQGALLTFSELKQTYGQIHNERLTRGFLQTFAGYFLENPQDLYDLAQKVNGVIIKQGDLAIGFRLFPRVPVTLVAHRDKESGAMSGEIYFDKSVQDLLTTENCGGIAHYVSDRLRNIAKPFITVADLAKNKAIKDKAME